MGFETRKLNAFLD